VAPGWLGETQPRSAGISNAIVAVLRLLLVARRVRSRQSIASATNCSSAERFLLPILGREAEAPTTRLMRSLRGNHAIGFVRLNERVQLRRSHERGESHHARSTRTRRLHGSQGLSGAPSSAPRAPQRPARALGAGEDRGPASLPAPAPAADDPAPSLWHAGL